MSDETGRGLVAVIGMLTALCVVPVLLVQAVDAARRFRAGDGLQVYRWSTLSLFGFIVLITCWRLLIWLDVTLWLGRVLGPTAARWRLDLFVGGSMLLLAAYPTFVFWRARSGRGQDAAALFTLAMRGRGP